MHTKDTTIFVFLVKSLVILVVKKPTGLFKEGVKRVINGTL